MYTISNKEYNPYGTHPNFKLDIRIFSNISIIDKETLEIFERHNECFRGFIVNLVNSGNINWGNIELIEPYLEISPFNIGRMLVLNKNCIELNSKNIPQEILEEITNGVIYQTGQNNEPSKVWSSLSQYNVELNKLNKINKCINRITPSSKMDIVLSAI